MTRFILCLSCLTTVCAHAQDTTRLSLMFIGDIMQHDSQIQSAFNTKTGRYDYDTCFYFIRKYFRAADLTIGNLELTLGGKPYKGYPQFSAPDQLAIALKQAGVDLLVTANNHSLDRRRKGLERTIHVLDSMGVLHTGTFRDTVERLNDYPLLISKNGVSLALLNYTYGTNGIPVTRPNVVNLIDTTVIARDLSRARELQPDVIVVFMHWGDEYQSQPNSVQKSLAEFCFNHGAMLVVGAHPHVLQPMYWYRDRNRLVAYSLGNFISGQRDHPRDGAASLLVDIVKVYESDSVFTQIADARHILHWVYRTPLPNRKFLVLPVPDFEKDTTGFITDELSRQAFHKFINASRKLLSTGKNLISELREPMPDAVPRYKVVWRVNKEREGDVGKVMANYDRFGLNKYVADDQTVVFEAGDFRNFRQASQFADSIRKIFPDAEVITFY
ncbi:MAG: CapA family protein [Cyclobacteriaceae bacterium]|nr:CapA family protein [Cyclobacteriaceae bacterium]MDW8331520.1 CapA family protein [Cyclobacteriaceae bacterium]